MSVFVNCEQADALRTCIEAYGDNWQAYYAAAEYAYYEANKALPEWGIFLETVEEVNGGYIFVHRDWGEKQ